MKQREARLFRPADAPPEPPLDFEDADDEDFDTLDTVELHITEENGSSSRVICTAIEGDTTGITTLPPLTSGASSSTTPGAR